MKKSLLIISLLSWMGDFCNSMLDVLYVFYAVDLKLTTSQIGGISSLYGLTYLITPVFIGKLVDKFEHKTSLLIATGSQTGVSLIYIFLISAQPLHIFVYILIGQMFRATAYAFFWPTIEMLYSEIANNDSKQHERNISLFCISWSLGAAMGTSFAGIFGEWALIWGFIVVSILYIIGTLLVLIHLKLNVHTIKKSSEIDGNMQIKDNLEDPNNSNRFPQILTDEDKSDQKPKWSPLVISLMALSGTLVFAVVSKGISGYFPNYAVLPNGLNISKFIAGQLMFAFGMGRFTGFLVGQFISNSFPKLISTMIFASIMMGFLIFINIPWILLIILLTSGFINGRMYYVSLELTLKYELNKKGAKAGLFESLVGLGTGISPLIAGFLAESNLISPFIFFSSFALIAAITTALLYKKTTH